MEERRKSNRRELVSTIVVKRLDNPALNEQVEIDIVDVSKTGIGFSCSKALEIGAVYEAYLRIWTQEVLHAFLEIVRIEKKGSGFGYGGIFIGMPEMDAARIEVYDTVETLNENM
ncbi:MAG: PilZ domain-containing protein [Lachnospiraceae bacterium]|nr:PilZ domain-containing protein [Lachnospiraceae bacterium]